MRQAFPRTSEKLVLLEQKMRTLSVLISHQTSSRALRVPMLKQSITETRAKLCNGEEESGTRFFVQHWLFHPPQKTCRRLIVARLRGIVRTNDLISHTIFSFPLSSIIYGKRGIGGRLSLQLGFFFEHLLIFSV